MGFADLCDHAESAAAQIGTTIAHMPRNSLVETLSSIVPACPEELIDNLIELLTYRIDRSARNCPLVRQDDRKIVCPPLITSRLVDRVILRAVAYDSARFGPIGRELGKEAGAWAEWLASIPGVLVAKAVKVVAPNRRTVGDLDIVPMDPKARSVVCLEIKSPVDAWSLTDVGNAEKAAAKAAMLADTPRSL